MPLVSRSNRYGWEEPGLLPTALLFPHYSGALALTPAVAQCIIQSDEHHSHPCPEQHHAQATQIRCCPPTFPCPTHTLLQSQSLQTQQAQQHPPTLFCRGSSLPVPLRLEMLPFPSAPAPRASSLTACRSIISSVWLPFVQQHLFCMGKGKEGK